MTSVKPNDSQAPLVSRRTLLAGAAAAAGGALVGGLPRALGGEGHQASAPPAKPVTPTAAGAGQAAAAPDPTKIVGAPTSAISVRSPFEQPSRIPVGLVTGSSLTPLQDLTGSITPADLHFERHHAGVPVIDPHAYELLVHGMVERPTVFTLDDLRRFPAVSSVHFIECSGNGRAAYKAPKPEMSPQMVDGLVSNTEWTGVPLRTLLREAGVRDGAKWLLAEGGDAALLARSVPMEKALDDALVAYAQNGEALRPANGYPVRLVLPGFEGNTNVKWLRRIEVGDQPWMTRWETAVYTDPLPNDTARILSLAMDAKSVITSPAFPRVVAGRGWWPISGLAWSGRGRITRVEVSTDAGKTWRDADLQSAALRKAQTRFQLPWNWDGSETVLMSRATDETGYTQPTHAEFRKVRGPGTDYHYNLIRGWRVKRDGTVTFEAET